jgi:hypothetical protein
LLAEYDSLVAGEPKRRHEGIRRTLEDRPWQRCVCSICQAIGIEVVVFRGNNRNRRRGFHNTHIFYGMIDRIIAGQRIPWLKDADAEEGLERCQLGLLSMTE